MRAGPGPELLDGRPEMVDAVQAFHHHAFDAEVVAPHPLDQLGVVDSFDPEPARPRHPGRGAGHGHRSRRRDGCPPTTGGVAGGGSDEGDGPTADRERPGGQAEDPLEPGLAPDLDATPLHPHQCPAEPAGPVADPHPGHRLDLGVDLGQLVLGWCVDGAGEDAGHGPTSGGHVGNLSGGRAQRVEPIRAPAPLAGILSRPVWPGAPRPGSTCRPSSGRSRSPSACTRGPPLCPRGSRRPRGG